MLLLRFCADIPAELTLHTNTTLEAGSTFNATCMVMRGILNFTVIEWIYTENNILVINQSFYTRTSPVLSLDLTLSPLNTSNAGTYNCTTRVEDNQVELIGIEIVNVTVKGRYCTTKMTNVYVTV